MALKVLGALYLVWMGGCALWRALRPARPDDELANALEQPHPATTWRAHGYVQGLTTNLLNPKAAVFFTALLPQFVTAHGIGAAPIIFGLAASQLPQACSDFRSTPSPPSEPNAF